MARIRTLKPTIWDSEQLAEVSVNARLLFVGLITQADDEGRLKGSAKLIKSQVFPYDDFTSGDIAEWLQELSGEGLIHWFEVNGKQFVELPTWRKHQRVSHPTESALPSHSAADSGERRNIPEDSGACVSGRERKGKEGKGTEGNGQRVRGREVTDQESEQAREIIAAFASHAQQRFTTDAWSARVIACLRAHPDLTTGDHLALIATAFRNPWWEGPPTPAVLYGSVAVFERQLAEWRTPGSRPKRKQTAEEAGMENARRWAAEADRLEALERQEQAA